MLAISELFGPTVQGEGSRAGNISFFIRFSGCNFSCPGFGVEYVCPKTGEKKVGCDTFYAVDRSFKQEWELMGYTEMVEKMDSLMKDSDLSASKPDIVITGGEPTLYWKNKEFQNFLIHYISRGHKITIETNGSIDIEFTKSYQKEIIFSMSVKLEVSGEPEHKRINNDNLTNILENTKGSYFKFVVGGTQQQIDAIGEEISLILRDIPWLADVYLMPLGQTTEELNKNALSTVNLAIKKGWKYTDRLHIRIWESKRGV